MVINGVAMNISLSGLENDFQKIGHDLTDREAIEEVKQYLYYNPWC